MGKPTTIAELLEQMPKLFLPEKAGNVNLIVQFNLSGEGGGTYHIGIADGKCQVSEGAATDPKATVTAAAADYLAIVCGDLNPVGAFMSGKLKIAGDMGLMMKFMDWFAKP